MKYCGVDYYPEHWGLDLIDNDLDNILELGCNLIRIADFAWDVFEPSEGNYSFEFFDEVIRHVKQKGLKVMMCIPSATMPSWLYSKYPEIMNEDETGYRQPFGARRGYCPNSDIYREKVVSLTKAIVNHYKDEDAIVAWQVDNEIGHEGSDTCYCENCHKKFIAYLKNKYKDLDDLNYRWGTHFWSHTYFRFEDIPLPKKSFVAQNPSLRLEYYRFMAESMESFIKLVVDTIKDITDVPVTHDFEGGTIYKHFNPFSIAKHLDFVSYNNYPVWGGMVKPHSDSDLAFTVDFARGFKRELFTVTESIMGAQGHNDIGCAPKPNEAKKWALQSLQHGVESVIFFRYRGYIKGAEQFCYGILDSDNEKRRKFYETKQFFKEAKTIDIKYPESKVAMVFDFDSKESMMIQRQCDGFNYEKECMKLYGQFYKRNINVDVIESTVDFSSYDYVVLPYMIIMDDEYKNKLKKYVSNGGTLIVTPRTAWKDKDNNLIFNKRIPVDLCDLCGAKLEEHESLNNNGTYDVEYKNIKGKASIFVEMHTLTTAKPVAMYVDSPFGEYASCFVNEYKKGKCYTLATSFDENILTKIFDEILN